MTTYPLSLGELGLAELERAILKGVTDYPERFGLKGHIGLKVHIECVDTPYWINKLRKSPAYVQERIVRRDSAWTDGQEIRLMLRPADAAAVRQALWHRRTP